MDYQDLVELQEYCYRQGKTINRGRATALITHRINEIRTTINEQKPTGLELAQLENEMKDLELLRKRL